MRSIRRARQSSRSAAVAVRAEYVPWQVRAPRGGATARGRVRWHPSRGGVVVIGRSISLIPLNYRVPCTRLSE